MQIKTIRPPMSDHRWKALILSQSELKALKRALAILQGANDKIESAIGDVWENSPEIADCLNAATKIEELLEHYHPSNGLKI